MVVIDRFHCISLMHDSLRISIRIMYLYTYDIIVNILSQNETISISVNPTRWIVLRSIGSIVWKVTKYIRHLDSGTGLLRITNEIKPYWNNMKRLMTHTMYLAEYRDPIYLYRMGPVAWVKTVGTGICEFCGSQTRPGDHCIKGFLSQSKFYGNLVFFLSHLLCNAEIASQFCTWHDSYPVVARGKYVVIWWSEIHQGEFLIEFELRGRSLQPLDLYSVSSKMSCYKIPRNIETKRCRFQRTSEKRFRGGPRSVITVLYSE